MILMFWLNPQNITLKRNPLIYLLNVCILTYSKHINTLKIYCCYLSPCCSAPSLLVFQYIINHIPGSASASLMSVVIVSICCDTTIFKIYIQSLGG